jgi:hypothetical protein
MQLTMQDNGFQAPSAKTPDHLASTLQRQVPTSSTSCTSPHV